jgi:4-diphosphocytidyl-2-C-methyl-D-erythritol kinase
MLKKIAKPKVNLYLHVKGKREDGYHLLESLVVFPEGGDELSVDAAEQLSLTVSGQFSGDVGVPSDNLVLKAAYLLRQRTGCKLGAKIELKKNLPVASGIGGGSADAAAILHLLVDLWKCDLPENELHDIGLSLGADIPACLVEQPLIMEGIGEKLRKVVGFPNFYILLVNSDTMVSTAEIFRNLSIPNDILPADISDYESQRSLLAKLKNCRNDLQATASDIAPDISTVLSFLDTQVGCKLARMSGSGATCFGLFESKATADRAAAKIANKFPRWWSEVMLI